MLLQTANRMAVIVAIIVMPPVKNAGATMRTIKLIAAFIPAVLMRILAANKLTTTGSLKCNRILITAISHRDDCAAIRSNICARRPLKRKVLRIKPIWLLSHIIG